MGGKRGRRERRRFSASSREVPREPLPSPGVGWQEPLTHLPRAGGHKHTGEVGKCHHPPLQMDSQHLTCDQRWALGQQRTSAHSQAPRRREGSGPSAPHAPSKSPGSWQVLGEVWGPARTLHCSRAREGFQGHLLQCPTDPAHVIISYSSFQTHSRHSLMELLGWSFFHGFCRLSPFFQMENTIHGPAFGPRRT